MLSGRLRALSRLDAVTVRRHSAMLADRIAAGIWHRVGPGRSVPSPSDDPRLALVTVNFSTTRYLKLMLLTLSEQEHLGLLHRIVIVDNASLDGGAELVDRLATRVPRVHAVHRRRWLGHGPGMRAGMRALDAIEREDDRPSTAVLFTDTDVVFRSPIVLETLVGAVLEHRPALIGEVRPRAGHPDIQASFVVVARDVLARRDVPPPVHDGSPLAPLQRAVARQGLTVLDLPTNRGGLVLHRGRAGVQAAARYRPRHDHARVRIRDPHYMGIAGGERIWAEIEARHAALLEPEQEDRLVEVLAERLSVLGTAVLEG